MRRQEPEKLEIEAQRLRDQGLCRVKFNPYLVEYKSATGRNIKIRMDYLNSYPEKTLKIVVDDLKDSPLIEEMEARMQLMFSIEENLRMTQERKNREAAENWAKMKKQATMSSGP